MRYLLVVSACAVVMTECDGRADLSSDAVDRVKDVINTAGTLTSGMYQMIIMKFSNPVAVSRVCTICSQPIILQNVSSAVDETVSILKDAYANRAKYPDEKYLDALQPDYNRLLGLQTKVSAFTHTGACTYRAQIAEGKDQNTQREEFMRIIQSMNGHGLFELFKMMKSATTTQHNSPAITPTPPVSTEFPVSVVAVIAFIALIFCVGICSYFMQRC